MDISLRAWHPEAREVESGYHGSVFVEHATVVDMILLWTWYCCGHAWTLQCNEGLCLAKVLHVPVNWKSYSELQSEVQKDFDKQILNICSCGRHIVHRTFKDGALRTWCIEKLLSSLQWLQGHSSQKGRLHQGGEVCPFSSKFQQVQMAGVFTCDWESSEDLAKGNILCHGYGSWKNVKPKDEVLWRDQGMQHKDPCTSKAVLLHFCQTAQSVPHPPLVYQTDRPTLAFLYGDMKRRLLGLMEGFMMPGTLKDSTSLT